jgi:hypothetical protein
MIHSYGVFLFENIHVAFKFLSGEPVIIVWCHFEWHRFKFKVNPLKKSNAVQDKFIEAVSI